MDTPFPFILDDSDLCRYTQPACPLQPSKTVYTYTNTVPVKPHYPQVTAIVRWKLMATGGKVVCAEIPVEIGDSSR
ncbi:unnamed protein product [Dicrocoelium dendriticum]|nr:unnamed protein product [Dicrocoelium dendriticum]